MRGQPVTVSALEQSVRQEMGDIRKKVNEMAEKARESYHRQRQSFWEQDKSYVGENLKSIGHFFMRVLGIVTGIIIFFLAASLSLAFLLIILRFPGVSIAEHTDLGLFPLFPFLSMVLEKDADLRTFSIGIIILIGIPPYNIPEWGIYLTDSDDVVYGIPRIYIRLSPDSAIYMHKKYTSMGSSIGDAADRAEAIEYSWSLDNNTLVLPESFTLPAGEKRKKQEVVLDLKLLQNCILITDDNLDHLAVHARGMSKREMSNRILIMTSEGVRGFVP